MLPGRGRMCPGVLPFPREYPATAREIIAAAFEAQADAAGQVDLIFNRIRLLASDPSG